MTYSLSPVRSVTTGAWRIGKIQITKIIEISQIPNTANQICNGTFIRYLPEFSYFGTDHIQRNYILFTEVEFRYRTQGNITICPAHNAIYSTRIIYMYIFMYVCIYLLVLEQFSRPYCLFSSLLVATKLAETIAEFLAVTNSSF
jgi:hypothetical protein